MDGRPPRLVSMLLLGASLLALGGLLWLWSPGPTTGQANHVDMRVVASDGRSIFNGTTNLPEGHATVLGALLKGADLGNFTVDVTYGYFGGSAFVTAIAGIHNQGMCGWVWDRNGVRGDRAADAAPVKSGDHVLWHWACEG